MPKVRNPYRDTPIAAAMDSTLSLLDKMCATQLVTMPPLVQSAIISASGCVTAYSNHPRAEEAARYMPFFVWVVLEKIDEALRTNIDEENVSAYMALKVARGAVSGMRAYSTG